MSVKDAVIEMIRALPENATWADIVDEGINRFGEPFAGDPADHDFDEAYIVEINRRIDDLRSGRTKGIPAEEVMARMKAKFG